MTAKFAHNICSCSDPGSCFGAFFCYPCLFGRTQHRLDTFPQEPQDSSDGWFGVPCLLMCVAAHVGCACIPVWMQRSEVRKRFGIKGNGCTDCLASTCCTCCSMVQQQVEVRERAEKQPMLGANGGYQSAPGGMVYATDNQMESGRVQPQPMQAQDNYANGSQVASMPPPAYAPPPAKR